jgi:uncharacterized protein (TIGR00369 family)
VTADGHANGASDVAQAVRNTELRARYRHIYQDEVAFNALIGMSITRWEPDGVRFEVSFRPDLSANPDIFHGGVVATLIDAAAGGAVLAGHDFANGSRLTTVSMTVHYLSAARGEGLVADARCSRRGRNLNSVQVAVHSAQSAKPVAEGMVVVNMTKRRSDAGPADPQR